MIRMTEVQQKVITKGIGEKWIISGRLRENTELQNRKEQVGSQEENLSERIIERETNNPLHNPSANLSKLIKDSCTRMPEV